MLVRLSGWFGRMRRERDWTAEFESHLQMHVDDNLRAGMSAEALHWCWPESESTASWLIQSRHERASSACAQHWELIPAASSRWCLKQVRAR